MAAPAQSMRGTRRRAAAAAIATATAFASGATCGGRESKSASVCSGTWAVDIPTRGEERCPFADPHAYEFSIDPAHLDRARRVNGDWVELSATESRGECRAAFAFDDQFSENGGRVELALHRRGEVVSGTLERACTVEPIPVSGHWVPDLMAPRDPEPTLRRAYATLLETCQLEHDMRAAPTSTLEMRISATGALVSLRRDGQSIDLSAACPASNGLPMYARDGFLGRPGVPTTRTLALDHRRADGLGVGPLILGLSTRVLPRLGLTREPGPEISGSFTQNGEARPVAIRTNEAWSLVADGITVAQVDDSPADDHVSRIRTADVELPDPRGNDAFIDLGCGITAAAVAANLEGWMTRDGSQVVRNSQLEPRTANASPSPLRPMSPCSFRAGDDVVAFAGGAPLFWNDGGSIAGRNIVLCQGGRVLRVRAGEPTRAATLTPTPTWRAQGWYEGRATCDVRLDARLGITCHIEGDHFDTEFRSVGRALLWINGTFEPSLSTRGMRADDTSACEARLDRFWKAFEPSAPYFHIPDGQTPELAYKLAPRAREWVAECERSGQESAPPNIGWDLDLRTLQPEETPPSAAEAKAIFGRLTGTWGDPDAAYRYDARFFRRAGAMWMHSGGADYRVSLVGPRTLRAEKPDVIDYRRFAFLDASHLYLNRAAVRPLGSRDRFRAGFDGPTFVFRDGKCVAFGSTGMLQEARCTFVRDGDAETLVLEVRNATGAWSEASRIPVVDGMLVHPDIHPFERK